MTLLRPSTPLIRSGNSVSRAEGGYIWSNGSDCMAVRNLAGQPDPSHDLGGSATPLVPRTPTTERYSIRPAADRHLRLMLVGLPFGAAPSSLRATDGNMGYPHEIL